MVVIDVLEPDLTGLMWLFEPDLTGLRVTPGCEIEKKIELKYV